MHLSRAIYCSNDFGVTHLKHCGTEIDIISMHCTLKKEEKTQTPAILKKQKQKVPVSFGYSTNLSSNLSHLSSKKKKSEQTTKVEKT